MSADWLKNRLTDLKYFKWILTNWGSLRKAKYSLAPFFKYWLFYPAPRLFFGRGKALNTSRNIIKNQLGDNLIIPIPVSDVSDKNIYYAGIRDSVDFDAFREVCIENHYNYSQIKPSMTVLDVGAHIGTFTLLASKKVGNSGRVIAVEAEAGNFNQLKKNLELNAIKNVVPVNIALSDLNGRKDFFIAKGSGCHSFFTNPGQEVVDKIKIKVKSLDSLMEEMHLEKIDLLKIDTEGAELEILRGARRTLLRNPNMKMVIAAYHFPKETAEVAEYLRELNFSPRVVPGGFSLVTV